MGYEAFTGAQRMAIQNGQAAREEMRTSQDRNALSQATQAYVGGDVTGARNALAANGNLDGVMALDRNTATTAATQRTTRLADEERAKATVLAGAQGLLRLPEEQWLPTFTSRVAPALLEVGIDQPTIDQILQGGISRQELEFVVTSLGGETESAFANDRSGPNGSIIRPGSDGRYSEVSPGAANPREGIPSGWERQPDGSIAPMRGYTEGRSDIAGATRAPPRARAGRSGGGSRSSGSGSAPSRNYSATAIQWD